VFFESIGKENPLNHAVRVVNILWITVIYVDARLLVHVTKQTVAFLVNRKCTQVWTITGLMDVRINYHELPSRGEAKGEERQ